MSLSLGEKIKVIQREVGTVPDGVVGHVTADAIMDKLGVAAPDIPPATKSTGHRHVDSKSLDLIKSFEGIYLEAYQCPAGVWTIGYGHTGLTHMDGTVYKGMIITDEEALELLAHDMEHFERAVIRLVEVEVNDDMFGALVSFAFNCGEGNLSKSTLLKKLNTGDYDGAADEFIRWNRAGGKVLNGLTRRRASEQRLFEGKDDPVVASVEEMGKLGYPVV